MSTVSKTAKASMKAGQQASESAPVLSDAERVRLIRIECSSNIYPSCENAHALLRAYDAALVNGKAEKDLGLQLRVNLDLVTAGLDAAIKRAEAAEDRVRTLEADLLAEKLAFTTLDQLYTAAKTQLDAELFAKAHPCPGPSPRGGYEDGQFEKGTGGMGQ